MGVPLIQGVLDLFDEQPFDLRQIAGFDVPLHGRMAGPKSAPAGFRLA
ncbi:MAG: hypothetical protein AB7O44_31875 [Hyphomicrobiaceae bacterium]